MVKIQYKKYIQYQYYNNNQQLKSTMLSLLDQIDFSKDLLQEPQLQSYLKDACKIIEKQQSEQILKFKKPVFDQDLQNHLIVTNIPDTKGKQEKFMSFMKDFLQKKSIGYKDGLLSLQLGYRMVQTQKHYNKTLYMIYNSPSISKKAYQKLHQIKLDKFHTISCFTVKQFKDVQNLTKQYHDPNLYSKQLLTLFNLDQKFRDQFVFTLKQGGKEKLYLKWFDHIQKKIQDTNGEGESVLLNQGNKSVIFSSKGAYIAACDPKGVRLFSGYDFKQKAFYSHEGVTDIVFSPNQTYMISFNSNLGKYKMQQSYILWAVQPEISLQKFKAQFHESIASFQFNAIQTRLIIGMINQYIIYNCESIEQLKKELKLSEDDLLSEGKLIKVPNLQKIVWLHDSVQVVCVCYQLNPLINSHPSSKISTYNTATKEQKKWRAIGQHIKKAEIVLSNNNDWVAVFFKKIQKKNLSTSVVYIVNLQKKQMQTQVIEFKGNIVNLSWDKQNGRFGAIYQLSSSIKNQDIKYGVSFYQIQLKDKTQQTIKFSQIPITSSNKIILAQNGIFFTLYNISPGKYKYSIGVFIKDVKTKKMIIEIIKQNIQIHYMSFLQMDCSGRFIITGTDKTYQIWTTSGELIYKDMFNVEIHNVHFRPRYMLKLSNEAQLKLQQKQKDIRKKYQQQDNKRLNALQYEKKKQKQNKKAEFIKYLEEKRKWFISFKNIRDNIRGFVQDDPNVKSAKYQYQYIQRNQS